MQLNSIARRKKPSPRSPLSFSLIFFFSFFLLVFLFYRQQYPQSLSPSRHHAHARFAQCSNVAASGERYLWYAPHSGFSNQLAEFKNAVVMAAILNRTLIVPPILDHHAVALGSCPKFRVLSPNELRMKVWDHAIELLRDGRYISMGDILDIATVLSSSTVRAVDFRTFVSLWCSRDVNISCLNNSNVQAPMLNDLKQCGSLLSGLAGNVDNCVYAVDEDCRTTVWTYMQNSEDGALDKYQPDEQLRKKKKFSYIRRRLDVYKNLGPGSKAHLSSILSFGSLFTAPYKGSESHIDIHESSADHRIQSLIQNIEFIPFVSEIRSAGQDFAHKVIQEPFLCAQLRILDGQFINHREATFSGLRQKVETLKQMGHLPVHIFVMTDLLQSNWSGTYLDTLARDTSAFKLHFLKEEDDYVIQTAKKVSLAAHGWSIGSVLKHSGQLSNINKPCPNRILPDVLLYLEETVCSCASLGFIGTAGSTIAETIDIMRKHNSCSKKN